MILGGCVFGRLGRLGGLSGGLEVVVGLAGVFGVFAHDLGGFVLVAVADGLDQAGVFAPGGGAAHRRDRRVVPADAAIDLSREVDQESVAGHLGDEAVQFAVR